MKILICGDSFAADWSAKYKDYMGWPNLLAKKFDVTNIAQAGVSEYKIYLQLLHADLDEYDLVIVSHTNPYRIPTRKHPIHSNDLLHKNADLIYADIEYHRSKVKNLLNFPLRTAANFFKHHFDQDFFENQYKLFRAEINRYIGDKPYIGISHLHIPKTFCKEKIILDFTELFDKEKGLINHFSQKGNEVILNHIERTINMLKLDK